MEKLYEKYLGEAKATAKSKKKIITSKEFANSRQDKEKKQSKKDKEVSWTVEKTWKNVEARTAADAVLKTKKLKHNQVRVQKAPKGEIIEL